MRTSHLVLIATAFVLGLASETLDAQVLSSPLPANSFVSPPIYQDSLGQQPQVRVASTPSVSNYSPYGQWYPYTIALPADRQWIRSTPIELRPNRPLHFWGNSRRRLR